MNVYVYMYNYFDVDPRNCQAIQYLNDAAKDIKTSLSVAGVRSGAADTLTDWKTRKSNLQQRLDALHQDRTTQVQQAEAFAGRLVERVEHLKRLDTDKINALYNDVHDMINTQMEAMDDKITNIERDIGRLDQYEGQSDEQVFVDYKVGQARLSEARLKLQNSSNLELSVRYTPDPDIVNYLRNRNGLGTVDKHAVRNVSDRSPKLITTLSARTKKCRDRCNIVDVCLLPDRTLVLVDRGCGLLTRLNSSYRVTDQSVLPGEPHGAACTGSEEVAVTLYHQQKVQFVSVQRPMLLTRSFPTRGSCGAVCYSEGDLFVSCFDGVYSQSPPYVAVYSVGGTLRCKIRAVEPLYARPEDIAASADGSQLCITCADQFVTTDRSGAVIANYRGVRALRCARGACLLEHDELLVAGYKSHNVLHVDEDGHVTELLTVKHGIYQPHALCYDRVTSKLVVTMAENDEIKVFKI